MARVGDSSGKGWAKTLWGADDNGIEADGAKVLTYWQAKTEVQKLTGRKPGADTTAATTAHRSRSIRH